VPAASVGRPTAHEEAAKYVIREIRNSKPRQVRPMREKLRAR
jgi:hypothetical protein